MIRNRIREWMKQDGELLQFRKGGKVKSKHLKGGGRKGFDEDMEEALFDWIVDLWQCNLCVSKIVTIHEAKGLSTAESFKASIGWLNGFIKSKGLSLQ